MKRSLVLAALFSTTAFAEEATKQTIEVDKQAYNAIVEYLTKQTFAVSYQCQSDKGAWFCAAGPILQYLKKQQESQTKESPE